MRLADVVAIAGRFAGNMPTHAPPMQRLDACLAPLARSCWPDIAWRFSRLTADGCPVEFGVSNTDDSLRVTFEIAGPEYPDRDRLGRSLDILRDGTYPAPDAATRKFWCDIQKTGRLRWGSWMGLRVSRGATEPKLYLEVPRDAGLAPPARLRGRVKMIGFDPVHERIETYVALPQIGQSELLQLLNDLDEESRRALFDLLGDLTGMPLDIALDWIGLGVSLVERSSSTQFALFLRARAVRDAAPKFRRLFAGNTAYRDWFDRRGDEELPDHGVLTFIPRGRGQIEVRAGLSAKSLMERVQ